MKVALPAVIVVLTVAFASAADAQTNDHFARQRREAVARQEAQRQHFDHQRSGYNHGGTSYRQSSHSNLGHWGGPTTTHRYYPATRGYIGQQNIQYYPVSPFGYGAYGYGVPVGGYYGGYSRFPTYYGGGYNAPNIYIHREIHLGR